MITYYIYGNTFEIKEELKKVIPTGKTFNNRWKYNPNFCWWELKMMPNFNSKKYEIRLNLFCRDNDLRLEKLDITNKIKKPLSDFRDIHTFFQYFFKHNYKQPKR